MYEQIEEEKKRAEAETKYLLSIDSGGGRGVIPIEVLSSLEEDKRLNGNHLCSLFDIVAGTSAGAISALGVAYDQVSYINDHYEEMSKSIFQRRWWSWGGLFCSKYSSNGRRNVFKEFIDNNGGEKSLKTSVIVPFILANSMTSHVYKNYNNPRFSLLDSVMSSTAAPTYFEPHIFSNKAGIKCEGVDGGLFASNPGVLLLQEAKIKYPDATKYVMLSIGTGKANKDSEGSSFLGRGLFSWARALASVVIDSSTSYANELLTRKSHSRHDSFSYVRIDPIVDRCDIRTDDVSSDYLERLRRITDYAISTAGEPEHENYEKIIGRLIYHKQIKDELSQIEKEKKEEKGIEDNDSYEKDEIDEEEDTE
jgi:hypothetical protein